MKSTSSLPIDSSIFFIFFLLVSSIFDEFFKAHFQCSYFLALNFFSQILFLRGGGRGLGGSSPLGKMRCVYITPIKFPFSNISCKSFIKLSGITSVVHGVRICFLTAFHLSLARFVVVHHTQCPLSIDRCLAPAHLCLLMSSTNLSQEDSLIDLKRELDHLGFDRNNPSTFVSGQPDVRERALTLVNSYVEIFINCSIGLLYKIHLKANTSSGKEKRSGPRSQPSITSFFYKHQKTDNNTGRKVVKFKLSNFLRLLLKIMPKFLPLLSPIPFFPSTMA